MRKSLRTSFLGLAAIAAIAAPLAFATSANATVAVTDGTGFVGKGDVQTALGYGNGNDAALQQDIKDGEIEFTQQSSAIRTTVAHGVQYAPLVDGKPDMTKVHVVDEINLGHAAYTTTTVTVTPKGDHGKVTGWYLTPGTSTTVKSTINYALVYTYLPGETFVGYVDEDTALTSHVTTDAGLQVSNDDKTVALPNTPVL
jgi:hypothetical protein